MLFIDNDILLQGKLQETHKIRTVGGADVTKDSAESAGRNFWILRTRDAD